jgi:hypothetical protein
MDSDSDSKSSVQSSRTAAFYSTAIIPLSLPSYDVNRMRASLQQCGKAAYTREESAYGGHYRSMRMSKGLVEEGAYSTTEGLGRQ